jgi:hypothetical protein
VKRTSFRYVEHLKEFSSGVGYTQFRVVVASDECNR